MPKATRSAKVHRKLCLCVVKVGSELVCKLLEDDARKFRDGPGKGQHYSGKKSLAEGDIYYICSISVSVQPMCLYKVT